MNSNADLKRPSVSVLMRQSMTGPGPQLAKQRTFNKVNDQTLQVSNAADIRRTHEVEDGFSRVSAAYIPAPALGRASLMPVSVPMPSKQGPGVAVRVFGTCGMTCFYDVKADLQHQALYQTKSEDVKGPLAQLVRQYGNALHVTVLDPSYDLFVLPKAAGNGWDGAIAFKVAQGHAIAFGNPLCAPEKLKEIDEAFRRFCRGRGLHVVVVGAHEDFLKYGEANGYKAIETGKELVINPSTNDIKASSSNSVRKKGYKLEEYVPVAGKPDLALEAQFAETYNTWRDSHAEGGKAQIYATVLDSFAMRDIMRYFYARDSVGNIVGLSFLMKVRGGTGYVLDPCLALKKGTVMPAKVSSNDADAVASAAEVTPPPAAVVEVSGKKKKNKGTADTKKAAVAKAPVDLTIPAGLTEFMIFELKETLKKEHCTYLSLGMDPLEEVGEIKGLSTPLAKALRVESIIRHKHHVKIEAHHLGGKARYHEKLHPDHEQTERSYLMPHGFPSPYIEAALNEVLHCGKEKTPLLRRITRLLKTQASGSSSSSSSGQLPAIGE